MTSKELNEILNKTRRTKDITLSVEQVEELVNDLEKKELLEIELNLEKNKVKYVMKQLKKQDKILEILKRTKLDLWNFNLDTDNFDECRFGRTEYEWYSMHYCEFSLEKLSQEEFDLLKKWLNNDK